MNSNWLWNFLIAFFTPFITSAIDFQYGYVFAVCNAIGGLIVYFFLIEGQGRTLEEIDTMYIERVPPRKSSKWVPPSKEEMARIRKHAGTADGAVGGQRDIEGRASGYSGDTQHSVEQYGNKDGINDVHTERV